MKDLISSTPHLGLGSGCPEEVAALLLEGSRRFLAEVVTAIRGGDGPAKRSRSIRVASIIEELMIRLDHEAGGELVQNLARVYEWWLHELLEGGRQGEVERLERIAGQMEVMQRVWEEKARQIGRPEGTA